MKNTVVGQISNCGIWWERKKGKNKSTGSFDLIHFLTQKVIAIFIYIRHIHGAS